MHSIYERIESLIKRQGLTKKAFCEQLNISTGNMGDWKRGKSTPGTHKLIEIAAFFNVSLDWLILGKRSVDTVKESGEDYFFGQIRQLNCQTDELLQKEKEFIKEYIEFTEYRKRKADDGNSN
ncbi:MULTISPECIES: helix-turn-helix domain-containing protein [Paenibacillus]|jgi:transcriptional regulator with XRE-family HTH domain|uniref:Helix-turn-helix domain-containing protein n=1 Tax=Paenibacillus phytohabitans TaxID=2654978 RepID=A0ABX1YGE6_9BACL|nr:MULTISPECIES: helix-turn-helix transcriptional regulator [Paenibacillus]AIQ27970.1 transcriptional regulator [Paenibacillus sp. FSL P4-0081]NOU80083.1 helix-turn-helix domain-containing protein [Paenibacillus phytohabitans]OMF32860.1 transcriptional regulator [Paenibacillus sp. FSL H8-0259]